VNGILRGRLIEAIDGFLVARTRRLHTGANRRIDAVVAPRDVEPLLARGALDSGGADQPGKRAGGIGAAGKSQNIDFIALCVIVHDGLIGVLNDLLQPNSDGPAEQVLQEIRIGPDAFVIEYPLLDTSRGGGLDETRTGSGVSGIELGDIGIVALAFLVPGPVDQDDNAFHCNSHRLA
jgi:hypothetical protein